MSRSITAEAHVILTFDSKEQMIYSETFILTLPCNDLESLEVETIRQLLQNVPADQLEDLVKISLSYSPEASEGGRTINLMEDKEANAVMEYLHHDSAKYYFQPNQRDDYEQRLVDQLGIASITRDA